MKWFYRLLIFLCFIPVQTLLLENLRIGGVKPDLGLILVFVQGWAFGEVNGLLWGLALGGLLDVFSLGVLGVNFALKAGVGYISGVLGKSLLNLAFWVNSAFIFILSVLHDVAGSLFLNGMGGGVTPLIGNETVARACYNSFFAMFFFFVFLKKANRKGSLEYAGALFPPGRKSGSSE